MTPHGRTRAAAIELAAAAAAVVAGAPAGLGLALGRDVRDWPIPFAPQLLGDFALRTTVYLSGFLIAFGTISIFGVLRGTSGVLNGTRRPAPELRADLPAGARDGHVSLAEPLYGFLPETVQCRLARETGYHALLYTKISILFSAGIGVLLAGSWEPVTEAQPIARDAALRIGIGSYLIAESVHRYIQFARGRPAGTLIGRVIHTAAAIFQRHPA